MPDPIPADPNNPRLTFILRTPYLVIPPDGTLPDPSSPLATGRPSKLLIRLSRTIGLAMASADFPDALPVELVDGVWEVSECWSPDPDGTQRRAWAVPACLFEGEAPFPVGILPPAARIAVSGVVVK